MTAPKPTAEQVAELRRRIGVDLRLCPTHELGCNDCAERRVMLAVLDDYERLRAFEDAVNDAARIYEESKRDSTEAEAIGRLYFALRSVVTAGEALDAARQEAK